MCHYTKRMKMQGNYDFFTTWPVEAPWKVEAPTNRDFRGGGELIIYLFKYLIIN